MPCKKHTQNTAGEVYEVNKVFGGDLTFLAKNQLSVDSNLNTQRLVLMDSKQEFLEILRIYQI